MKKTLLLVFAFVVSSTVILLSDAAFFSMAGKITLIGIEAAVLQILLMDKSFLNKKKRAELRKAIDD